MSSQHCWRYIPALHRNFCLSPHRSHLISFLLFYLLLFLLLLLFIYSKIRCQTPRRTHPCVLFFTRVRGRLFLSHFPLFPRVSFHLLSRTPFLFPLKIISRADGTRKWNCTGVPRYVACFIYDKIKDLFLVRKLHEILKQYNDFFFN